MTPKLKMIRIAALLAVLGVALTSTGCGRRPHFVRWHRAGQIVRSE